MTTIGHLPNDILCEIFTWLPGKFTIRQVCKLWRRYTPLGWRIAHLSDEILQVIFNQIPEAAMAIRMVCRRWCALAPAYQTTLAALHWRNVNSFPTPHNFNAVQLSIKHGYQNNIKYYCEIGSRYVVHAAASCGALDVLKCVVGSDRDNYYGYISAAEGGHLEVLKWMRSNGYAHSTVAPVFAATRGHLEVIQWMHEMGDYIEDVVGRCAAQYGYLPMLKWANEQGLIKHPHYLIGLANAHGHTHVAEWLSSIIE